MRRKKFRLSSITVLSVSFLASSSVYALNNQSLKDITTFGGLVQVDFEPPYNSIYSPYSLYSPYSPYYHNQGYSDKYRSDISLRRAKLFIQGENDNWFYNYAVKSSKDNIEDRGINVEIGNAYITYKGISNNVDISLGYMPAVFGYENSLEPSNYNFMDDSILNQMVRTVSTKGVGLKIYNNNISFSSSFFINERNINEVNNEYHFSIMNNKVDSIDSKKLATPWGLSARLLFSPVHEPRKAYHVGGSVFYNKLSNKIDIAEANIEINKKPSAGDEQVFKSFGQNFVSHSFDMSVLPVVENTWHASLEGAVVKGLFSAWSEIDYGVVNSVEHRNKLYVNNSDWYFACNAEAVFVLTGESHIYNYMNGTIDSLKPSGAMGALDVSGRVSYISFSDGLNINKDRILVLSASATWYINQNASIKGKISLTREVNSLNAARRTLTSNDTIGLGVRAQLSW